MTPPARCWQDAAGAQGHSPPGDSAQHLQLRLAVLADAHIDQLVKPASREGTAGNSHRKPATRAQPCAPGAEGGPGTAPFAAQFVDDTEPEAVDVLEGRAALWRDSGRLGKWTDRNHTGSNNSRYQVLLSHDMQVTGLRTGWGAAVHKGSCLVQQQVPHCPAVLLGQ